MKKKTSQERPIFFIVNTEIACTEFDYNQIGL